MVEAKDLKVGRIYCAKKPKYYGLFPALRGDRQIIWLGTDHVQYDGPAVKMGRHYPKVTIEQFLKWADRDCTDELPKGEWLAK